MPHTSPAEAPLPDPAGTYREALELLRRLVAAGPHGHQREHAAGPGPWGDHCDRCGIGGAGDDFGPLAHDAWQLWDDARRWLARQSYDRGGGADPDQATVNNLCSPAVQACGLCPGWVWAWPPRLAGLLVPCDHDCGHPNSQTYLQAYEEAHTR